MMCRLHYQVLVPAASYHDLWSVEPARKLDLPRNPEEILCFQVPTRQSIHSDPSITAPGGLLSPQPPFYPLVHRMEHFQPLA